MARTKTTGRTRKRKTPARPAMRVYTLEVFIISGPLTRKFAKANRVVSRTILIRGDQTLLDLHHAIFAAFGREQEHMHEYQFGGKWPMDPEARRYVLPGAFELNHEQGRPVAGRVDLATLDSLGLEEGDRFGYWFDFGDDWWHQANVEAVEQKPLRGKYPRVARKVGKNPPQYADFEKGEG